MKKAIQVILLSIFLGLGMSGLPACGNDNASTGNGGDETVPDMPAGEVLDPKNTPSVENQEEQQELIERGRDREDL